MRLATLTSVLLLVGCANQGDEGMIVLNNTAVTGGTCTLTGGPEQPFSSHGEIFAFGDQGYFLTPLIQSRVSTRATMGSGSSAPIDPLTRTIFLRGADVQLNVRARTVGLTTTQENTVIGPYSVLFSGSLPPGGTVNVGFEVIPVPVLRQIIGSVTPGDDVSVEVEAQVTIKGDLNGDSIEAQPFYYPISVCADCVVNVVGTCPYAGEPSGGNACNPFQDGRVDCCVNGDTLICPATTGTP